MRNLALVALTACLAVGVLPACTDAFAGGPPTSAKSHDEKETFKNLYIEPSAACSQGFKTLSSATGGVKCSEMAACAAPGARIGQKCIPATNLGADGGSALQENVTLGCRCFTDAIYFKLCINADDAGVLTTYDAGYYGSCVR